jgi:hypothetical protein
MKLKQILFLIAGLICCSPNSKDQDNLIGNWNKSNVLYLTEFTQNDSIIATDTIYDIKHIQINSNEINFNSLIQYKIDTTLSTDTLITFSYSKQNDSLIILMKSNKSEYYKYNIQNDSLTLIYLYGDTIPIDSFTTFLTGKYKKQ